MSDHQIEANRRNSQLSTGPRTPEGKAISRFNALKTGKRFTRLQRRIDSTERSYYRALTQLQRRKPRTRPLASRSPTPTQSPAPELASFFQLAQPSPSPSIGDLLSSGHEFLGMDRVTCFATDRFQHPDIPHYFNPRRKSGGRADTGFGRGSSRPGDRADQIRARR